MSIDAILMSGLSHHVVGHQTQAGYQDQITNPGKGLEITPTQELIFFK